MSAQDDTLDRRDFIVAAAAAVAVAHVPFTRTAHAAPPAESREVLADWSIDDMWGVYPRPSEPIGYGRPHGDGETALFAMAQPADWQFLV